MHKKNILKKHTDELPSFDFSEELMDLDDGMINEMFCGFVEASNNQIMQAMELTKLIVNKNPDPISADKIFDLFSKSMEVIANNTPMKDLLERFPKN